MQKLKGRLFAAVTAAALIAAGGCSGHAGSALPQTPGTHNGSVRHPNDASPGTPLGTSLFHANTEKYSDKGSHPVTGRSGSAAVQSRALLAKDGSTLIEATTAALDAQPGPGNFRHVTVTPTLADGSSDETVAYNNLKAGGYWSHTYTGLARNESVTVDTNVTDLDPRTDVVTTVDTVKKRPDLAALKLTGPAKAYPNQPVSFTATVAELNGDVGAHADCILSADGQQVDQALGIWVDAAGTVSCTFQTSFATTGTKHLTVAVSNVVPGDWDTSNNSASTTIEIVEPVVKLATQAWAENHQQSTVWNETYNAPWENYSYTSTDAQQYSNAYINGYTYAAQFQFPQQSLSGKINIDGTDALVANLTLGSSWSDYAETCQWGWTDGASGEICSAPTWTSVYVSFYGTQATYYSKEVDTSCTSLGCTTYTWVYNDYEYNEGQVFNLGSTDVFSLTAVDAAGTKYEGVTAPASVSGSSWNTTPYSYCGIYDWYDNSTWCESENQTGTNQFVSAYGSGT